MGIEMGRRIRSKKLQRRVAVGSVREPLIPPFASSRPDTKLVYGGFPRQHSTMTNKDSVGVVVSKGEISYGSSGIFEYERISAEDGSNGNL